MGSDPNAGTTSATNFAMDILTKKSSINEGKLEEKDALDARVSQESKESIILLSEEKIELKKSEDEDINADFVELDIIRKRRETEDIIMNPPPSDSKETKSKDMDVSANGRQRVVTLAQTWLRSSWEPRATTTCRDIIDEYTSINSSSQEKKKSPLPSGANNLDSSDDDDDDD